MYRSLQNNCVGKLVYFVFRTNKIRNDISRRYKLNDNFIHDWILFTALLIYIYFILLK